MNKYNLNEKSKGELMSIIRPIFNHPEFQKRMKAPFFHHGEISLGEHILEDTILTYKYIKNKTKYKFFFYGNK